MPPLISAWAFPQECCGFLLADRLRAARNVADQTTGPDGEAWPRTSATGYVLAAADVRFLDDSLGGPEPVRTLYHSHPNGRAYFSAEDLAHAVIDGRPVFPDVLHLVVGVTAEGVQEARLFDLGKGLACEVGHWDGAALAAIATDRATQEPTGSLEASGGQR
jgi:proteasome lid subunit RPN8/RPN11